MGEVFCCFLEVWLLLDIFCDRWRLYLGGFLEATGDCVQGHGG